jgi:hypothetical protein
MVQEVIGDRVGHGSRDLGAARAVEVGDRSVIVTPLQRREMGADLVNSGDTEMPGCGE